MASAHEHFSEQFHKWEMRGRGWQVFPQPVYPEPPFVPFRYRPMTETPAVDDGRRPTFLSSLARKLARPAPVPPPIEPEEESATGASQRANAFASAYFCMHGDRAAGGVISGLIFLLQNQDLMLRCEFGGN